MHPLSKNNFGPTGLVVLFNNGSATVAGHIVKQTSWTTYLVTDGTVTVPCQFAQTPALVAALPANTMTIAFNAPSTGAGAAFSVTYSPSSATPATAGSGYAVNDTVTIGNGTSFSVTSVNSGAITGLSVSNPSNTYTSLAGTSAASTTTTGSGTGAIVTLLSTIASVVAMGGTQYSVGSTLAFAGMVSTTAPVVSIATISPSGAPLSFTVQNPGAGISVAATTITTVGAVEHVSRLAEKRLNTVEGHNYTWQMNGSAITAFTHLSSY